MEIMEKVMKLTFKFHSLCGLNDQGWKQEGDFVPDI